MTPVQTLAVKVSRASGETDTARPSGEVIANFDPAQVDPHLVCLLKPNSEQSESYSRLRLALETLRPADQCFVLGITSAGKSDGKTLTSINLAGALAGGSDSRVLLIDLNLRDGSNRVSDYLKLDTTRSAGVTEWLNVLKKPVSEPNIRYIPEFNLHVLVSGKVAESPYELLKSRKLVDFIASARQRFDFIIVDTPKVLNLPDTELISRLVDSYALVVRADKTNRKELEETLNLMSPAKVIGLVLNDIANS